MNADAFRQFYDYHFTENRKIWDTAVMLSQEQFTRPSDYSVGSVRDQIVHLMSCDDYWFSGLRGLEMPDMRDPTHYEDRALLRAHWDIIEQNMRAYLATLRDEMLFEHPFPDGEDRALVLWQVLVHVVNHGTDHRAQLLRLLNDLTVKTGPQDYIFYIFDNL
jgi:uncharacterized damage-inducible protein DinB